MQKTTRTKTKKTTTPTPLYRSKMSVTTWYGTSVNIPAISSKNGSFYNFITNCVGLVAALYTRKFGDINIVSSDRVNTAYADRDNNKIVISSRFLNGDFSALDTYGQQDSKRTIGAVLGVLLHEIGHFVHSPSTLAPQIEYIQKNYLGTQPVSIPVAKIVSNLVEDIYIEYQISRDFPTLSWMLEEINKLMLTEEKYKSSQHPLASVNSPASNLIRQQIINYCLFAKLTGSSGVVSSYVKQCFKTARSVINARTLEERSAICLSLYTLLFPIEITLDNDPSIPVFGNDQFEIPNEDDAANEDDSPTEDTDTTEDTRDDADDASDDLTDEDEEIDADEDSDNTGTDEDSKPDADETSDDLASGQTTDDEDDADTTDDGYNANDDEDNDPDTNDRDSSSVGAANQIDTHEDDITLDEIRTILIADDNSVYDISRDYTAQTLESNIKMGQNGYNYREIKLYMRDSTQPLIMDSRYIKLTEIARQRANVKTPLGLPKNNGNRTRMIERIITDGKIFSDRKDATNFQPIDCMIVIDCSGSMGEEKFVKAINQALGCANALVAARCNVQVYGHTSSNTYNKDVAWIKFKDANESIHTLSLRCSAAIRQRGSIQAANRDGYALEYFASLMPKGQRQRIMLVISDGAPSASKPDYDSYVGVNHTRSVVEAIRLSGIKVQSLSIDRAAFYPNNTIYGTDHNVCSTEENALDNIIRQLMG